MARLFGAAEKIENNARECRLFRELVALVCLSRMGERRVQAVVGLGDMGGGRALGGLSDFRNEGVVGWQ